MARMYPNPISPDTKSSAERELYRLLAKTVDHSFVVIHNVAWVTRNYDKEPASDGETDFLIAHPEHGVLVIEVKGGEIILDQRTQEWFSIDRNGHQHKIKDPFQQSTQASHTLFDKLSNSILTRRYSYDVRHAVAFPDVGLSGDLRPDAPREIIIDQSRLEMLEETLLDIFDYWKGNKEGKPPPGAAGIEALVELLAPRWHLRSRLSHVLKDEDEQIKKLTENQFQVLSLLQRHRRAAITGGAGTGKTMLAIEKACRLVAEGFSVLLVCFNRPLAEWLQEIVEKDPRVSKEDIDKEHLLIATFHGLCGKAVHWAEYPMPAVKRDQKFYDEILPDLLLQSIDKMDRRFDAIIVDEGQDFKQDSWWLALEALLKDDERGIFYVFFDDNQRIYSQLQHIPVEGEPFSLNTNCRNTKAVHDALTPYSQAIYETNCDRCPKGRPVQKIPLHDADPQTALRDVLLELVDNQNIEPTQIMLLTPRSMDKSQWREGERLGTLTLTWNKDTKLSKRIRVSTIQSFKGLESPIIILTELEYADSDEVIYVGMSRARNDVIVIGDLPKPIGRKEIDTEESKTHHDRS